ncbi:MAG: GNAT family N-acetyltransferase [Cyclobacteriaceae bacterium]|nr:GNAT family N-acetyltransferase [Cyclobacteriaceae bacterium]
MSFKTDEPKKTIITERLVLGQLSIENHDFIFELVNTQGWIEFIGDKKIYSTADATAYIQKINATKNIYWTVKLKDTRAYIGLITFIKRDYLPHYDLGFAFLPNFNSKGYGYESTKGVLTYLKENKAIETILAISKPNNTRSIHLLQKLGFQYEKEVKNGNVTLHVYEASIAGLNSLKKSK